MATFTRRRGYWLLAASASALLVVGALLPPALDGAARAVVHEAFAPVCHQLPGRSFALGGVPLAVCHRCLGIYVGLLAGVLAWPLLAVRLQAVVGRRTGLFLLAAGAPAVLDWTLGVTGVWPNTAASQASTGALLGIALGLVLARAAMQAGSRAPAARSTDCRAGGASSFRKEAP